MTSSEQVFFSSALAAGSILTGFCGTFLSFRIQREANYFRQPAICYGQENAIDVVIGRQNFSSGFFVLILATLIAMIFGFVLPMLALFDRAAELGPNLAHSWISPRLVSGGLLSALPLICGYFWIELLHYHIVFSRSYDEEWLRGVRGRGHINQKSVEFAREGPSMAICIIIALGTFFYFGGFCCS